MNSHWGNPWYYNQHPQFYSPPWFYNAGVRARPLVPLAYSSKPRSLKYPKIHPALAADTTLLSFDMRMRPRTNVAPAFVTVLHEVATANYVTRIRVISQAFPWTIEIASATPLTVQTILKELYEALQKHIDDSEWGLIIGDNGRRETIEKARRRRLSEDPDKRLKRIDFLGDATIFNGLAKDEEFERMRLLPNTGPAYPDTWVVKLGTL